MKSTHAPLRLRPARGDDHAAVATLMPELGMPGPPLARERWERELLHNCLVAHRGDTVVGFLFYETLIDSAYVRHLVVAPGARSGGIGRALMLAVARRLRAEGLRSWQLNVRPGNAPALALYHSLGLETRYESTVLRFDWARIDELPAQGEPLAAAPVAPGDDARVEAAFGLPPGQLARARAVGRILVRLDDAAGAAAAFAAFDPDFPGAFPFRVRHVAFARPLLLALRPHALPGEARVQIVADGDPELVAALRAIGAEVRDEILHLAGPLTNDAPVVSQTPER